MTQSGPRTTQGPFHEAPPQADGTDEEAIKRYFLIQGNMPRIFSPTFSISWL